MMVREVVRPFPLSNDACFVRTYVLPNIAKILIVANLFVKIPRLLYLIQ